MTTPVISLRAERIKRGLAATAHAIACGDFVRFVVTPGGEHSELVFSLTPPQANALASQLRDAAAAVTLARKFGQKNNSASVVAAADAPGVTRIGEPRT